MLFYYMFYGLCELCRWLPELCQWFLELCHRLPDLCHWLLELCHMSPHLPLLVLALVLAVPGRGVQALGLLYCGSLACRAMNLSVEGLIRRLSSALASPRRVGSRLLEAVRSSLPCPFPSGRTPPAPGPARPLAAPLGGSGHPWHLVLGAVLLLGGAVLAAALLWGTAKRRHKSPAPAAREPAGPVATPTPLAGTAAAPNPATPAPVTDTVATPAPLADTTVTSIPITPTLTTGTTVTPTPTAPTLTTGTTVTPTPTAPTLATGTTVTPTPTAPTLATGTTVTPTPTAPTLTTGTTVTPTPTAPTLATGTTVTPTPTAPTLATGTVAEPKNQLVQVPVIPVQRKKWTQNLMCVRSSEEAPAKEEEKTVTPTSTTTTSTTSARAGTGRKLCPMQEHSGRCPGEATIPCLPRCLDSGAGCVATRGQGSLGKDEGAGLAPGRVAPAQSLCRQLAGGERQRCRPREMVLRYTGPRATLEGGAQVPRGLAVCQVVCAGREAAGLPGDPTDVRRWGLIPSAPTSSGRALVVLGLGGDGDGEAPAARQVASWLRQQRGRLQLPPRARVVVVGSQLDVGELPRALRVQLAQQYPMVHISSAFLSIPRAPKCWPQLELLWRGLQRSSNRPALALLEGGGAPGPPHDAGNVAGNIVVWGDGAAQVLEREQLSQTLLGGGVGARRGDAEGPAGEVALPGRRQIPLQVVRRIAAAAPPASDREVQAFLATVGSWQTHIPNYSRVVAPLQRVALRRKDFRWGPAQQQAFEHVKQEVAHAVALGPVRWGRHVQTVLYATGGEHGPTWSLWQSDRGESRCWPLGFWSREYCGAESRYTRLEKEALAAYEGVRVASEVVDPTTQLLLAPQLPVLGWMFQGTAPATRRATDATWGTWRALITRRARGGQPGQPGILEVVVDWPKDRALGIAPERS